MVGRRGSDVDAETPEQTINKFPGMCVRAFSFLRNKSSRKENGGVLGRRQSFVW